MRFEGTKVFGLENALIGMRLPMSLNYENAKEKCGSWAQSNELSTDNERICKNLIKADKNGSGSPNSKFLRMIHVQVAITAPLYFWKEADTYKIGTVANSTSTMHKLASNPITMDCFEMDDYFGEDLQVEVRHDEGGEFDKSSYPFVSSYWSRLIDVLESLRRDYIKTKDKRYWKELVRILPESWLQTRMFDCNYAVLRNIYSWRKNHKLTEWHTFCDWIKTLPYAEEFLVNDD